MKMLKPLKVTLAACLIAAFASTAYANSPNIHTKLGKDAARKGDLKSAITHFKKAEKQGDIDAKFILASMYILGKGVKVNNKEAARLLLENCNGNVRDDRSCEAFVGLMASECQAGNQVSCKTIQIIKGD